MELIRRLIVNSGVTWLVASTVVAGASGFLAYLYLAYIGEAEVLGRLAIINIVVAAGAGFQEFGFSSYLVHKKILSTAERSTLFFLSIASSAVISSVVYFFSEVISVFYQTDDLQKYMSLAALLLLITGLGSQYQANYVKSHQLVRLSKFDIFSKLVFLASCLFLLSHSDDLLLAYMLCLLGEAILKLVFLLVFSSNHWRPRFTFSTEFSRLAIGFGVYQAGSQLLNMARSQADQLLIGKVFGMDDLGVYSLAKTIVMQPLKFVGPICSKVYLPRFATHQNDRPELIRIFQQAKLYLLSWNTCLYLIVVVAFTSFAIVADVATYFDAIDYVFILLIMGLLRPMGTLLGSLSQSLGRSDAEFEANLFNTTVMLLLLATAIQFNSLLVIAIAMMFIQMLSTGFNIYYISRKLFGEMHKPIYVEYKILTAIYLMVVACNFLLF